MTRVLKSENLTVSYRSFNRLGENYNLINPNHPVKISENEVQAHLRELDFKYFKDRSKLTPVFSENQIQQIKRLLTKGLNLVNQEKFLHFEIRTPKGKTEGDVFAAGGYIHWRIWIINGVEYSNDPLGIRKKTWRLIPVSEGHRYFISSSPAGKKTNQNWIMADLIISKYQNNNNFFSKKLKKSSSQSSKDRKPKIKNKKSISITEKLTLLKQLLDQGLINEDEYNKKKKDIMKTF